MSDTGISVQDVTLETADGPMRLYEAKPPGEARGALVVVQEAFGVNPHIEDVTRRAAAAGYHAVAPDFFHRSGPGAIVEYGKFELVMEYFQALGSDESILMDVDAALAHLHAAGFVTGRFPQFPALLSEVSSLQTPWLGLFGDQDGSIPVDDVEQLRAALTDVKVDTDIVRYPEAGHGFHCDQRPDYRAEDAADAWRRALDWFSSHLA
jgi:carboxymethylenebutenolidase